jgi:DNA invertase Pin-like site-specific DNA recombinase
VSQVDNHSLAGQAATLAAYADGKGWSIEIREESGGAASGKTVIGRDVLNATLDELDAGAYDALIVTRLDRLARNTLDGLDILRRATANGWTVVVLDLNIDTSTPVGEAMVTVLWAFATYERRVILERTASGRERARIARKHLGRHSTVSPSTLARIVSERASGALLRTIADGLNRDGLTSPAGRPWNTGTVSRVARSVTAQRLRESTE